MAEEQMTRYIRTCREWPDPQAGIFQLLALYTGMRRSEVRKLKWADVDLDRGFLLLRDPKSGEDQRVPLGDAAIRVLKSHQRVQHVSPNERCGGGLTGGRVSFGLLTYAKPIRFRGGEGEGRNSVRGISVRIITREMRCRKALSKIP